MSVDWSEVAFKLAKKKINEKNQIDADEFFFVLSLVGESDFNKECIILRGFQEKKIDIFFRSIHEDLYRRYKLMEGNIRLHDLLVGKSDHIKEIINLTKNISKCQKQKKEGALKPTEKE